MILADRARFDGLRDHRQLGRQRRTHLHPEFVAHLIRGQGAHLAIGSIHPIQQLAKPHARRLTGDELPHTATLSTTYAKCEASPCNMGI
jgi:hypothetical protein